MQHQCKCTIYDVSSADKFLCAAMSVHMLLAFLHVYVTAGCLPFCWQAAIRSFIMLNYPSLHQDAHTHIHTCTIVADCNCEIMYVP